MKLKYIWTNHLFINNKESALVGEILTSIDNNKRNNFKTTTTLKYFILFLPIIICIVLGSVVHHIGGWNSSKFMYKFKYT